MGVLYTAYQNLMRPHRLRWFCFTDNFPTEKCAAPETQ